MAFNTRSEITENMLIVMKKSTHEKLLLQPQTDNKQIKLAVFFLTGYMESSMLRTKTTTFTSRFQLLMKLVSFK